MSWLIFDKHGFAIEIWENGTVIMRDENKRRVEYLPGITLIKELKWMHTGCGIIIEVNVIHYFFLEFQRLEIMDIELFAKRDHVRLDEIELKDDELYYGKDKVEMQLVEYERNIGVEVVYDFKNCKEVWRC